MQSLYELWVKSCADDGVLLNRLEWNGREETGLFQTKTSFLVDGVEYFTSPVYQVWVDGKCVSATGNYLAAIEQFKNLTRGGI